MKRIALFASALALAAGPAFAETVSVDAKLLETLQARIASLETRVHDLEAGQPGSRPPASAPKTEEKKNASAPAPTPAKEVNSPSGKPYVITEGDTVSEIARKHGIPRTAFMEANNIREGQQIYIGDTVIIPSPPKSKTPSTGVASNTSGATSSPKSSGSSATYTIKYGDTLSSIARKHKTTVDAIKAANNMKSDSITGGQKLKIPAQASSNSKVADGSASTASAGESSKKSGPTPPPGKTELLREDETYGLYTIEKGDTLFSLARDFFTSQQELQRLNEMGGSTVLHPGKDVIVPTSKYFDHHQLAGN